MDDKFNIQRTTHP